MASSSTTGSNVLVKKEQFPEHKSSRTSTYTDREDVCKFSSLFRRCGLAARPESPASVARFAGAHQSAVAPGSHVKGPIRSWYRSRPPQRSALGPLRMLMVGARGVGRAWAHSHSPGTGLSPGCRCSAAAARSARLCSASPCARPLV